MLNHFTIQESKTKYILRICLGGFLTILFTNLPSVWECICFLPNLKLKKGLIANQFIMCFFTEVLVNIGLCICFQMFKWLVSNNDWNSKFYRSYVDNIFYSFKNEHQYLTFRDFLNRYLTYLHKLTKQFCKESANIKTYFNGFRLTFLVSTKDKGPCNLNSNVVYHFFCDDCNISHVDGTYK